MNRSAWTVLLIGMLATPAWALKSAADRDVVEPLRRADLASILDAVTGPPAGWQDARARLPAECRNVALLTSHECDDAQRCAWLGARASAIEAWSSGSADARSAAADWLYRVAERLGASGRCGRDEATQARWREDREQSARDAAHALLALLSAENAAAPDGPDVLLGAESRRVSEAVRLARKQGVSQLATVDVSADRALYRTAWHRRRWLAGMPAIAAMRALLVEVWMGKPVPADCGAELLRNDLLEDQWRGFLVQEAVPKALTCIITGAPQAGLRGAAANAEAKRWADAIGSAARADAGGRDFGADPERARQVRALRTALQALPESTTARLNNRSTAPASGQSTPPALRQLPPARSSLPTPRVSAVDAPGAEGGTSGDDLIRLAGRVGELIGDTERMHAAAKRARTPQQRMQQLSVLLVELHRSVCAPLEAFDLGDLDAVRTLFKQRGVLVREEVCRGGGETSSDLQALLAEAPRLRKLWAATVVRGAAGLTALRRCDEAIAALEQVPEPLRGEAWAIVAAWTQRTRGDQVAAARAIARVGPDRLEQLRNSGQDHVVRLVAHASVTPN